MRPLKPNGEWGAKRKDSYALDDNGNRIPVIDQKTGKQKIGARGRKMWERISIQSTDWNDQTKAEEWRKSWADVCNEHLKGQAHIDHRSYARQGKEQLPMLHESYAARKIAKRGGYSYIIEYNDQIRELNRERELIEREFSEIQADIKRLEQEKYNIQKGQEQDERTNQIRERLQRLAAREREFSQSYGAGNDEMRTTRITPDVIGTKEQSAREENTGLGEQIGGKRQADTGKGQSDTTAILQRAENVINNSKLNEQSRRTERADTAELIRQSELVLNATKNEEQNRGNEQCRGNSEKGKATRNKSKRKRTSL